MSTGATLGGMGIRGLAGDMARNSSVLWRGFADAVDPDGRPARADRADPADRIDLTSDPVAATTTDAPPAGPNPTGADGFAQHGGSMVVPLDTWTRILEQVGNVHEAGQQLADARERAARAETENTFLREQLTEFKAQRRPTRRPASKPGPAPPATNAQRQERNSTDSAVTRVRRRVGGWLTP